jgi:hypothetical protein
VFILNRNDSHIFDDFTPMPEPAFVLVASLAGLLIGRRFIRHREP